MNIDHRNTMMQTALRCGVSLFVLSGACVLNAQAAEASDSTQMAAKKTVQQPVYKMKTVKGVVYDAATQQPLGGVRVQALNNRFYTALTNEKGEYDINVPEHVTALYVSTDGYNGVQVGLRADELRNVYLYSDKLPALYSNGTSLLQSYKQNINNSSSTTVENDLELRLNGAVRSINRGGIPGQGAALFINGINSLNTNAQPLVVVDGVVWDMQYNRTTLHQGFYNNILSLIDTEDIESVEVLRNGTALYGAEGANGVILITTKRGRSMATRINIRAYGGFEQRPEGVSVMNANQYKNYLAEFLGTTELGKKNAANMTVPFLVEDKGNVFYQLYHNNTDWQKDIYQTAFTQNYRVNVQGGDEVAMYGLSMGYTQSEATAKMNDFSRFNVRFNTDINLFTGFTTTIDMGYVRNAYGLRDNGWATDYSSKNISSPNVLGAIQAPFIDPYAYYLRYQGNNSLGLVHNDRVYTGENYSDANNPFRFATEYGYAGLANPYWVLQNGDGENKNFQEHTQFLLNVAPRYEINKNLVLSNRFAYVLSRSNEKYFMPASGTPIKSVDGLGNVQNVIASQFGKETTLTNDLRLEWSKNLGKHQLDIFGGFRIASYTYSDSYSEGYNNGNDKTPNLSYRLSYLNNDGVNDRWVNLAYYANVDYNFLNRYFVKVIASAESSSRFGKQADSGIKIGGVKWGLFPSVQAGWVMSNENWFKVPFIDYARITAGYEASGNDAVDYYSARTYFRNIKFLDRATALELANIQNPKIQWETTHRLNAGLQLNMFRNRLALGVEVFHATTTNLLTRNTVSDITGLHRQWTNGGELTNTGGSINVNAVLINHKDFKWNLGFSVSHYKNEITKLPNTELNKVRSYALDKDANRVSEQVINGYTSSIYGQDNILTMVGEAAGVFYGYKTAGVFATSEEAKAAGLKYPTGITSHPSRDFKAGDVHFVDVNGDGWINEADRVKIGDPNPDIYGSFFTTLSYKRFTLDLNFKYSLGNDVYNYQRMQLESGNNIWNQTTAVVNRWRGEGHVTNQPRTMSSQSDNWVNNERFSDRWIEDGSYLKLKRVRLTYELPISLSWLQGLTVWGEANNVFTLTKYLGSDPEVTAGNGVLYQGIDAGMLMQNRSFNLGLTINL